MHWKSFLQRHGLPLLISSVVRLDVPWLMPFAACSGAAWLCCNCRRRVVACEFCPVSDGHVLNKSASVSATFILQPAELLAYFKFLQSPTCAHCKVDLCRLHLEFDETQQQQNIQCGLLRTSASFPVLAAQPYPCAVQFPCLTVVEIPHLSRSYMCI